MPLVQKSVAMLSNRMPKVINPTTHAVIDYAVAATFFAVGAIFWTRNKRAAISSLVCGFAATVNSMITDYPGGVFRRMSYQNHGRVDMGLAGLTAAMPDMMGFDDEREARFFSTSALAETLVTVMTDFDAQPGRRSHFEYRDAA